MIQKTATTIKNHLVIPNETAQEILGELRLLRRQVMLLLPQEDIKEYAHSKRIEKSYKKALNKYPPDFS